MKSPCLEHLEPRLLLSMMFSAEEYVDITQYGVDIGQGTQYVQGDGSDETDLIKEVLEENAGKPIYFPKTDDFYGISDEGLTYLGPGIVSNGATIKSLDEEGVDYTILTISETNGTYVGDLVLAYDEDLEQNSDVHFTAFRVNDCSDFIVERVTVIHGTLSVSGGSDQGIVRDCQVLDSGYMGIAISSSSEVVVENCYAERCIAAFRTENASTVEFLNNTGYDSDIGLRIEDSVHVLAEGNLFKYCTEGALVYGPQSGSSYYTTDITLRGNTFYHCYKNITADKDDSYVNTTCEYALSTKATVGDVYYENNIIIGDDESESLTDLSSNVVYNTGSGYTAETRNISTYPGDPEYYTMVPEENYAYFEEGANGIPDDWLFYVNLGDGFSITEDDVLTMDTYYDAWTQHDWMVVKLYSDEGSGGSPPDSEDLLCSIPLYNPYAYIALPTILRIPDGVSGTVKCILVEKLDGSPERIAISDVRKGLQAKVGYLHSYLSTTQNAVLDSNVFVDVDYSYVDRQNNSVVPPTIITGSGMTGTTAQRPANPTVGWRYYDTDLDAPIYWDGSDWIEINTYWMTEKVNGANHFDGDNYVNLGNNERVELNHYTIEGWIQPDSSSSGVSERIIVERCDIGEDEGFMLQLWNDDKLYGYQAVNDDFYEVAVYTPFPHDGEYHHVAMTFNYNGSTSTLKLYIDGELKDTNSAAWAPNYPDMDKSILVGDNFEGTMGDLNFHTQTLDADEIEACYERCLSNQYASWRCDEGAGVDVLYDSSPYGTAGTENHNVGVLVDMDPDTCRVDGKRGKGLSFDGDGYANLGNDDWMLVENYTVSAWIMPTTSGEPDRIIFERGDYCSYGYAMQLYSDNKLYAYQSVEGDYYAVAVYAPFPYDDAYHQVTMAFSYDGVTSTLKLYIDGQCVDEDATTGAPDIPQNEHLLGDANDDGKVSADDYASVQANFGHTGQPGIQGDANYDGMVSADDYASVQANFGNVATEEAYLKAGRNFVGVMDEVKFYRRTLTADEIEREYLQDGELFVPPSILTVGQGLGEYTFLDALDAVSANQTIQFIDDTTYNITSPLSLTADRFKGVTIESGAGRRATLNFTGSGTYGMCFGQSDMTIRKLTMIRNNSDISYLLHGDANSTDTLITEVRFIHNVSGFKKFLLSCGPGWYVSYCTFYSNTTMDSTCGGGIRVPETGVTIDHCSFDHLGHNPIYNWNPSVSFSVTNCALGSWYNANEYNTAIRYYGTLYEDYNYSWGDGRDLTYGQVGSSVTHGGHSVEVNDYDDIFVDETGDGHWKVNSDLYTAASDGTTIGAWQW